jgi:hypothetical protein
VSEASPKSVATSTFSSLIMIAVSFSATHD